MTSRYIYCILLWLWSAIGYAQYVSVADTAFARFLCENYPDVMSADCAELDTIKASEITGNMIAQSQGIHSVSELVYFTQLSQIKCEDNEITDLPDLSRFTNLTIINFNGNKLSGVLDFSEIETLKMIIMNRNADVVGFTGVAQLADLQSLQFIACGLTSLPDLSGLTLLDNLLLYQNRLTFTDLYPLSQHVNFGTDFRLFYQEKATNDTVLYLPQDVTYTIGYNMDESLSGLTYRWFKNGEQIKESAEDYYTITSFSLADEGKYQLMVFSNNSAFLNDSIVTGVWECRVELPETLTFSVSDIDYVVSGDCYLPSVIVSSLVLYPELSDYNITAYNKDFDQSVSLSLGTDVDILPGNYDLIISAGGYQEQKMENLFLAKYTSSCVSETVVAPNGSMLLSCPLTDLLSFDSVVWYKDDVQINNADTKLRLADFHASDAGLYYCLMHYIDYAGTQQYFTSSKWNCILGDCLIVDQYNLEQSNSCSQIEVKLSSIALAGKEISKTYLVNNFNADTIVLGSDKFVSVSSGSYQLVAESTELCVQTLQSDILLALNSACIQSFTPNGDGVEDDWYISFEGGVQIFDVNGQLVKELHCPSAWDGTSESGSLAPDGKYLILYDDRSKETITLFR